jgi:hypothetical protein
MHPVATSVSHANMPVSAPQGQYETRLLEQSIYKICALLAVGFGDAGAEVIAENIKKEGDLNPCMPGKKTVRYVWAWRGTSEFLAASVTVRTYALW